jgi:hypothetical protein
MPYIKISTHDLADADTDVRRVQREVADLTARYPAITSGRLELTRISPERVEARLELLLPQHQVIVNAADSATQTALRAVLVRAASELQELGRRDAKIRPPARPQAKAA